MSALTTAAYPTHDLRWLVGPEMEPANRLQMRWQTFEVSDNGLIQPRVISSEWRDVPVVQFWDAHEVSVDGTVRATS